MVHIIYTIGHSSHALEAFLALLEPFLIERIIDIRRSPRSTRFPQYNIDQFKERCSLQYSFQGDVLGARRRRRKSLDGLNNGLTDSDAHAYADHMQRPAFRQCVNELVLSSSSSSSSPVVLMCSENNPEQCHRSLLADYLCLVHKVQVVHILFNCETREHQVHSLASFDENSNTCIYSNTPGNLITNLIHADEHPVSSSAPKCSRREQK